MQAVVEQDVGELALADLLDLAKLLCLRKLASQLFTLMIQLDALTRSGWFIVDGPPDFQLFEVMTTPTGSIMGLIEFDDLPSKFCHELVELLLRILLLVFGDPNFGGIDVQLGV